MKNTLAKYKEYPLSFVFYLSVFTSAAFIPAGAFAAVQDVLVTDVSAKAFSVIWAADDKVTAASAAVFSDPEGAQPVPSAKVDVISSNVPSAHSQGLVKLSITGLQSSSTYYVQIGSAAQNGSIRYPQQPPFLKVSTAAPANSSVDGQPSVNELMTHQMISPNPAQSSRGRLVVVDLPGLVFSPLSAFVGEHGLGELSAVVDLNNLLSPDGQRFEISQVEQQIVTVTELRGFQACEGLEHHKAIHYRLAPKDQNIPKLSKLSAAVECEQGDFNCDGLIDGADRERLASAFGAAYGDCLFNGDLDIVPDQVIDSFDQDKITSLQSQ